MVQKTTHGVRELSSRKGQRIKSKAANRDKSSLKSTYHHQQSSSINERLVDGTGTQLRNINGSRPSNVIRDSAIQFEDQGMFKSQDAFNLAQTNLLLIAQQKLQQSSQKGPLSA